MTERSDHLSREWCVWQTISGSKSLSCSTAGADRTVFSADFLNLLRPLQITEPDLFSLVGVGGKAGSITIETAIGFTRDDGKPVSVRGTFRVFTDNASADLSVLGRDVTNNFSVTYDYPSRMVVLLAPPHFCEFRKSS